MTTKIRVTGTAQEIKHWKALFDLLARSNVISLLEVSDSYSNRGNSQYQRAYLEAELKVDVTSPESPDLRSLLDGSEPL